VCKLHRALQPWRIACGNVIGPPKSSSELPLQTSRKQVQPKWLMRVILCKLNALVAPPWAAGTSTSGSQARFWPLCGGPRHSWVGRRHRATEIVIRTSSTHNSRRQVP
jgi:hypothetical protein